VENDAKDETHKGIVLDCFTSFPYGRKKSHTRERRYL
jgi:hypothetical protein